MSVSEFDEFSGGTEAGRGAELGAQDAEALDALCAAGFDCDRVSPELRERARRAAGVLGLLDRGDANSETRGLISDESLVDATLARVAQARAGSARPGQEAALSNDDEDALELLVGAGFRADRVPARVRDRARKAANLLRLLEAPVASGGAGRESLVQATMAHVQKSIESQQTRMKFDDRPVSQRRIRLGDLISVAAVLALAGSVLIPMGTGMRELSRRSACQSNMSQAGLGFGQYAGDYKDSLPMASASTPGSQWWFVGEKDRSNSANLYTLTRAGYTKAPDLTCPGNPGACSDKPSPGQFDWKNDDQVSFSYQNMFSQDRPRWAGPVTVTLLGDRSPIIPLAKLKLKIHPLQNSLQHGGTGQSVLRSDRSVLWLKTPVLVSGDNIYLPRPLEELFAKLQRLHEADPLQGTETPGGADDVFLAP